MRGKEDYALYEQLLSATRDQEGVEHRDQAREELAQQLASDKTRLDDFAHSRAEQVDKRFHEQRVPEAEQGQLAFAESSYLVLGDNESIRVDQAKAVHTRLYLEVLAVNHAKVAYTWSVKDRELRRLVAIQQKRRCTLWQAYLFDQGK